MLTTYNIFDDIMGLKNMVDGYFEGHPAAGRTAELPLVNIYEKDDRVTARFLTPGIAIEDIDLQLVDNDLKISLKRNKDLNTKPYIRRERSTGSWSKTLRIPFRVNSDSIKASLENGILTVTLDKSEDAKPKKIAIQ